MPIPSSYWDSTLNGTYPQEFQDRYRNVGDAIYDDFPNRDPASLQSYFNNAGVVASAWSAAEAFAAWYFHNMSGGASSFIQGGDSWEDPYIFKYNDIDKCHALRSLGCRANTEDMCRSFNARKSGTGRNEQGIAVQNTLYELSQCNPSLRLEQGPFVWGSDGSLCIYDRYNFDSFEDFSPGSQGVFGVLTTIASVAGCLAVNVNDSPIGEWRDAFYNWIGLVPDRGKEPYLTLQSSNNPISKVCAGKGRYMYTKACFTASEVRECNPELYFDFMGGGSDNGTTNYAGIPGAIPVGDKQPSPFLGLPFQPPVSVDIEPGPNYFGFNYGDYSAPFNSWSQGVTNATFDLGPYAKIKRFWLEDSTCKSPKEDFTPEIGNLENDERYKDFFGKGDEGSPLYGRIIYITSGVGAAELGFICQNWYYFNDEPYNTVDGTASGERYPSKAEWWESAVKSPMTVRFMHLSSRPYVKVEVAASGPLFISGSPDSNYYPGQNLSEVNNLSYDILQVMLATAAISRWI